jgi:hypothetical protein
MYDPPDPAEILGAVARFLKTEVAPATPARLSFQARVAANAVEMVARQLTLGPPAQDAERARLAALLDMDAGLETLNAELARRIAVGEMDLATPGLADHLWAVTLAKMAVDQPTYAAYRASLAQGEAPTKD